jgi:hypothetical protein
MKVRMAGSKDDLKARLSRYRQIKVSVIGRRSGRMISIPVWFVLEGKKLYLNARAGLRHAAVQERAQEPFDPDRCAGRASSRPIPTML